jgi:phosphoglycerol transferase MdoB-like AlkP superfamily enzyme
LNSAGYRTLATHGFTSLMFNRGQWYQRFGFQQTAFLPELQSDGASVCDGAFPGACDADVARWVGDHLAAPRDQSPMFVHWVTLNSHLPISPLADGTVIGDCVTLGIAHERSLCSWFRHVQIVHESVAQLAVRRGLRPTVFVIVGDHAPPFLRAGIRSRFSQTEVPYVILFPRSLKSGQTDAVRSDIRAGKVQ